MAKKEKTLGADDIARQAEISKDNQESNEEENDVVGLVKNAASDAYKGLTDAASKDTLGQRAAGLVGSAANAYAEGGIGAIGSAVTDGANAVGESVSNGTALADAGRAVDDAAKSIAEGAASNQANTVLNAGKVLGGAAAVVADGVSKGTSSVSAGASDLSDAAQKTLEGVQGAFGDFAKGVQSTFGDVATGAGTVGSAIADGVNAVGQSVSNGTVFEDAGRAADGAIGSVAENVSGLGSAAKSFLSGLESQDSSSEKKSEKKSTSARRTPNAELMGTDNSASDDFSLADSMTSKYC